MTRKNTEKTIGGWHAPCAPIDYEKLAREAARECTAIQSRLQELKAETPTSYDEELTLRRRIRILTGMYYEQRTNRILFTERAAAAAAEQFAQRGLCAR